MNSGGDAAEQIVRMSLEGTDVALRLSGSAAKNVAAAVYTVLKNQDKNKIKGRQRLTAMLKSGKELKVFSFRESQLKQFVTEAKRYGVVYCVLRGKDKSGEGCVDVMVRAEDASKINRIVERLKMATVDTTISQSPKCGQDEPVNGKAYEGQLLEELLGTMEKKKEEIRLNPFRAGRQKAPPSENISKRPDKATKGISKGEKNRPSVRKELQKIQATRQVSQKQKSRKRKRGRSYE